MPVKQRAYDVLQVMQHVTSFIESSAESLLLRGSVEVAQMSLQPVLNQLNQLYRLYDARVSAGLVSHIPGGDSVGLPLDAELNVIYGDAENDAQIAGESFDALRGEIVDHVMRHEEIPSLEMEKLSRACYRKGVAEASLQKDLVTVVMDDFCGDAPDDRMSFWSSWCYIAPDGRVAIYIMRFESSVDVLTDVNAKEDMDIMRGECVRSRMSSPGVMGKRIDDAASLIHPKDLCAYYVERASFGRDISALDETTEWREEDAVVEVVLEVAQSFREKEQRGLLGMFSSPEQEWHISREEQILRERMLVSRHAYLLAQHPVLQRLNNGRNVTNFDGIVIGDLKKTSR